MAVLPRGSCTSAGVIDLSSLVIVPRRVGLDLTVTPLEN